MNEITNQTKLRDPFAKFSELTVQKEEQKRDIPAMTMTSLEISELVKSNHADVRRSIERLTERGVISLQPTAEVKIQKERREETVSVYVLPERDTYIVVAQLSPEFTAKLVDRWRELEVKVKDQETLTAKVDTLLYERPPIPTTATPFLTTSGYEELKALALKDAQWEVRSIVGRRLRSFLRNLLSEDSKDDDGDDALESPSQAEWIVMHTVLFIENAVKLLELERGVKAAKGKPYVSRLSGHKWEQPKLTPQSKPSDPFL